jgi:hypothetical protein
MRRRPRSAAVAALACALAFGAPAAAYASAYDQALQEFQRTGTVNGCNYADAQLRQAETQLGKTTAAVPAQFPTALQAAIQQRNSGLCGGEAGAPQTRTAPAPAATQPTAPQTTPAPAPAPTTTAAQTQPAAAKAGAGGASRGVVLLTIVGILVLLVLALWGAARWWAFEPPWLLRWRHATAEAGWRASNAWAEFTDWLRLGR